MFYAISDHIFRKLNFPRGGGGGWDVKRNVCGVSFWTCWRETELPCCFVLYIILSTIYTEEIYYFLSDSAYKSWCTNLGLVIKLITFVLNINHPLFIINSVLWGCCFVLVNRKLYVCYTLFYHGHVIDPVAFKSSLAVVYWTIYHPQYTTPNRN